MSQQSAPPRERAIAVADAVLHLPSPHSADRAWQMLAELERLAGESRSANQEAASNDTGDPLTWLRPSTELASRAELTAAHWTASSPYPWHGWDQAAAKALDQELSELDRIAAEVTSVAAFCAQVEHQYTTTTRPANHPEPEPAEQAPQPRRRLGSWAPLGLTTAALVGLIGGFVATELAAHSRTPAHAPARPQSTTIPTARAGAEALMTTTTPLPPPHSTPAAAPGPAELPSHPGQRARQVPDPTTGGPAASSGSPSVNVLTTAAAAAAEREADERVRDALRRARQEAARLRGLGW